MKTFLTMMLAALLFVGCEEKEPEVAPPIDEEGVVDPAEEMMEEGHEAMHGEGHDEMHGEMHDEMHGEGDDEMHHDGPHHGAETVEVSADGTKFEPPIEKDKLPADVWYCDMGTVHYASTQKGDGKCPLCGMKLVQHEAGATDDHAGHDH